jgi:hypothetical protein
MQTPKTKFSKVGSTAILQSKFTRALALTFENFSQSQSYMQKLEQGRALLETSHLRQVNPKRSTLTP